MFAALCYANLTMEDIMKIRKYAKSVGFEVIGKLTRRPEWEHETNGFDGGRRHSGVKSYSDDGGNVYHVGKHGICIVAADDSII